MYIITLIFILVRSLLRLMRRVGLILAGTLPCSRNVQLSLLEFCKLKCHEEPSLRAAFLSESVIPNSLYWVYTHGDSFVLNWAKDLFGILTDEHPLIWSSFSIKQYICMRMYACGTKRPFFRSEVRHGW